MRASLHPQLPLAPALTYHSRAHELRLIGTHLDELGEEILEPILRDLVGKSNATGGRNGMSAEQVLRALIVKQHLGVSYDELAFLLSDSCAYHAFCRFQPGQRPTKGTLQRNIKKVGPESLEGLNGLVARLAVSKGLENGYKIRGDSTATQTLIHEPSDSSLLWDCVRVLTRLMHEGREYCELSFTSRVRMAKRRMQEIQYAKRMEARVPLYRRLHDATQETVEAAERAAEALDKAGSELATLALASQIRHYVSLAYQVLSQTRRRVFDGESVASDEKLVSIFEPHTDIIVKGRRDVVYGHKLFVVSGSSGLILDCIVGDGNPADSTQAVEMVRRTIEVLGRKPKQAAFDGGFASRENLETLKDDVGLKDVAFHKKCGLEVDQMAQSKGIYRRLKNFRAGIESGISLLKRRFGLTRCTWRSLRSFKSYVWASILSSNLFMLARLELKRAKA